MKKSALVLLLFFVGMSCKKNPVDKEPIVLSPEIVSITPATAAAGDAVVISGKHFKTGSTVLFGTVNAQISSLAPAEINVIVPTGSGAAQVVVHSGTQKSNAVAFTYAPVVARPVIASLNARSFMTGDTITITGNNFDGTSKIYFDNEEVAAISSSPTSLAAIIPVGVGSIKLSVKNTTSSGVVQSNLLDFSFATVSTATAYVGGISYKIDTLSYFKIGPGAYYMALHLFSASAAKPIKAFITVADMNNQYLSMIPVIGRDSVSNQERPSAMAIRKSAAGIRYIAGTNSDFYNTTTIYPRNANMIEGVLGSPADNAAITGSLYAGNAIFDAQKKMYIDAFTYSASATIGSQSRNIDTINYYTMSNPNSLMFFNIYCGKTTGTNNNRTEVAVTPVSGKVNYNGETDMKVVEVYPNQGNHAVSNSVSILSGTGTGKAFLDQLNVNDVIKLKFGLVPRSGASITPHNIAGGRQIIMKNGSIQQDFWNGDEKHPRTGIGFSNNGSKVYMCVIDGRSTIAADVLTSEMAQIMKYYGATDALNLDGGGSSTMYLDKVGTVNNPSDGTERSVVAGIFAVSKAPDDSQIAEIAPKQFSVRLAKNQVFTPVFYGLNQYGQVVNTSVSGINITTNSLGTYSGTTFTAGNKAGYGYIVAKYGNLTSHIKIIIE